MNFSDSEFRSASLTKTHLAELLIERLGLNKRESKELIDLAFHLISGSLVSGDAVKLSGFGTFQMRSKASRPGRNPRTGLAIPIQARRVVIFRPSEGLKKEIQGINSKAST